MAGSKELGAMIVHSVMGATGAIGHSYLARGHTGLTPNVSLVPSRIPSPPGAHHTLPPRLVSLPPCDRGPRPALPDVDFLLLPPACHLPTC